MIKEKMECYTPLQEAEKPMRFGVGLCKKLFNQRNILMEFRLFGFCLLYTSDAADE